MKRERRKFSADFKAKVALEAIKERSTVLQISSKYKISPAQVTKWKHEFLERSASVFEKEAPDQKESEKKEQELYSKIGELQVQPGGRSRGLFKKSLGEMSVHQKRGLILRSYRKLPVSKQCALLELPRSSYYFKPRGENLLNQFIMNKIDIKFTECPFYGVERMTDYINYTYGLGVNVKRIRRLYKMMALDTLMPKPGLSKKAKDAFISPYLLNNLIIDRSNQVWQADITYVAMQRGFMYKFAIIDVYSRKILGWGTSNTMSVAWMIEVLESAIRKYGKPEIFNSDQGSQFTSLKFVSLLKNHKIKQSMDGKGRALDNVFIERYWRSYKYEYLFLNPPKDAWELFSETEKYVKFYNKERRHEALERLTPNEVYFNYRKLPNVS